MIGGMIRRGKEWYYRNEEEQTEVLPESVADTVDPTTGDASPPRSAQPRSPERGPHPPSSKAGTPGTPSYASEEPGGDAVCERCGYSRGAVICTHCGLPAPPERPAEEPPQVPAFVGGERECDDLGLGVVHAADCKGDCWAIRDVVSPKPAPAPAHPESDPEARIFSGDYSKPMWAAINGAKTEGDLREALYFVCCRIQELEDRARREGKPESGPLGQHVCAHALGRYHCDYCGRDMRPKTETSR